MANTPTTPSRPGSQPTRPSGTPKPPDKPGGGGGDRPTPSSPLREKPKKEDDEDEPVKNEDTGELATEPVTTSQQRVYVERGRSGGAQRTGAAGDLAPEDDPSQRLTPSGRKPKSPTPGVPSPYTFEEDPTAWDPRLAAEGTPIAFPEPDEPYPQEGTPYPPPVEPPAVMGVAAARALNADGTAKNGGKKSDADVASHEAGGPRIGQSATASGEANLGGKPSRQYDTP